VSCLSTIRFVIVGAVLVRAIGPVTARVGLPALAAQQTASAAVTFQDLLDGLKNPSRWLTYSGDYSGQRHSPLTQITPANVDRLAARWTFQSETMALARGFECFISFS
jgi:glucose dehydrogenase